jgi:hypothetical protein
MGEPETLSNAEYLVRNLREFLKQITIISKLNAVWG